MGIHLYMSWTFVLHFLCELYNNKIYKTDDGFDSIARICSNLLKFQILWIINRRNLIIVKKEDNQQLIATMN